MLAALAFVLTVPVHAQNVEWAESAAPSSAGNESSAPVQIDDVNAPILPSDPTPVPLEGGLTLLGAAGAAYAVRRLRLQRAR